MLPWRMEDGAGLVVVRHAAGEVAADRALVVPVDDDAALPRTPMVWSRRTASRPPRVAHHESGAPELAIEAVDRGAGLLAPVVALGADDVDVAAPPADLTGEAEADVERLIWRWGRPPGGPRRRRRARRRRRGPGRPAGCRGGRRSAAGVRPICGVRRLDALGQLARRRRAGVQAPGATTTRPQGPWQGLPVGPPGEIDRDRAGLRVANGALLVVGLLGDERFPPHPFDRHLGRHAVGEELLAEVDGERRGWVVREQGQQGHRGHGASGAGGVGPSIVQSQHGDGVGPGFGEVRTSRGGASGRPAGPRIRAGRATVARRPPSSLP